ncbi:MAG TPA: TIM barrel protein [Gryllotalpicola sp.]
MPFELVANVSTLFTELPLLERPRAAADAGFQGIEVWWPFSGPQPEPGEVDALVTAVEQGGIPLRGLNLWAGDQPGGERGVLSHPERREDFEASLQIVHDVAERTGCRHFNALYGQRVPGLDPAVQASTALGGLSRAVELLGPLDGTLLIEPLAHGLNGDYPLETAADARAVVDAARTVSGSDRVALLFDTFHLAHNGDALLEVVARHSAVIGHVQLADDPGRGEPGSGGIDFAAVLDSLAAAGYAGRVAAEYFPTTPTTATSLGWVGRMPGLGLGGV